MAFSIRLLEKNARWVAQPFKSCSQVSFPFTTLGLDFNFHYYSALGQSNWFATVGPDISVTLGEISGLKGGYFSAIGYKAQAVPFSAMLTLQGSVLDVSQARIKTEVDETVDRLEHSELRYEVFVKLRYDF